jgi:hypothetical protein
MNLKPREFIEKSTVVLIIIGILFLLDAFVPNSFYNDIIDQMRIFRFMGK